MNLYDFGKNLNPEVVSKGYDYYKQGRVDALEEIEYGVWQAFVYGREVYSTWIKMGDKEIVDWNCTCPYDHGPACKHVIATSRAIVEILGGEHVPPEKGRLPGQRSKKYRIEEIIDKTSKEDLANFVREQMKNDHQLKNRFIVWFAELLDEDDGQTYRSIVQSVYKAARDRSGFIDYRSAEYLSQELCELLGKADELLGIHKPKESVQICKAILEIIPDMMLHMGSDGESDFLFSQVFSSLEAIAEVSSSGIRSELFSYCTEEFPKSKYQDYGFEMYFLDLLPLLVTTKEQEKQFFILVDNEIEDNKRNRVRRSEILKLIRVKVDYLLMNDRERAFELIEANLDHPDFREILVNHAMKNDDMEIARELCLKGIKMATKQFSINSEARWMNRLFDIANIENNIPEVRRWAERLFEIMPVMDHYRQLKAAYSETDWTGKCEELIARLEGKSKNYVVGNPDLLARIFVEENYHDRLLTLLQVQADDIVLVDRYAAHLKESRPVELIELYSHGILRHVGQTGRKFYNEVASFLYKMKEIRCGDEAVAELIAEFNVQYSNRPAMMEVLRDNFPETHSSMLREGGKAERKNNMRLL